MGRPRLAELQSLLARSIAAEAPGEALPFDLLPGGTLTPGGALEVYRVAYAARLTEALGETYEAAWTALGDEAFRRLCRGFIRSHPSFSHNLSDYGREFPAWLGRAEESARLPFLEELAAFEWEFKELFHQREHAHLPAGELAAAGPRARFEFGAAVRLRRHRRAAYALWTRRKDGPPERAVWDRPERLALYKLDGEICARELEEPEFMLLEGLRAGASMEEALDAAATHPGFDEARAAALFSWIGESGIIGGKKE